MATEISFRFLLSIFYRIFTEYTVVDTAVDCHEVNLTTPRARGQEKLRINLNVG